MKPEKITLLGPMGVDLPLENIDEYYIGEMFVPVIFYDGRTLPYYISNYGRLYSIRYKRLIKPYLDKGGYYRVSITKDINSMCFTGVHKLELMSFYPIYGNENGIFVPNHKNGIKTDNFILNLEWVTISENTQHALNTGLANYKCENNARSYLSNETVNRICELMEQGKDNSYILDDLGYQYGKERNRVAAILRLIHRGQTYLDISSNYNIPGLKGKRYQDYTPEDTMHICEILSDGKDRTIKELCDSLNIPLDNRKMFRNFVDDVCRGVRDTYIASKYTLKRPVNVDKNDPNYWYYN